MNVPDGWRVATLGEVAPEVKGSLTLEASSTYELWSVPSFSTGAPETVTGSQVKSSKRPVVPGDVLLCKINPRINRVWAVGPAGEHPQVASPEWIVLRPRARDAVDASYLQLFLSAPHFREWITTEVSGVTGSHTRAKPAQVLQQPISFPPLPEQHRIVETVEEHMARLDAADASLASAERRVATLKAGKLRGLLVGPARKLGDLAVESRYGTSTKCEYTGTGIGVARIPNLVDGAVVMADEKRAVDPTVDLSDLRLSAGDVLIVRTNGSANLIGRSAVVENDMNVAFASYLIRYRFDTSVVHPRWVHMCLESLPVRRQLEARAASSAGQYNLGLKKLHTVEIPVPSVQEQSTAIDEWDAFSSTLRRLDEGAARQRLRSTALRRAVLAAAFSGRLTPHRALEVDSCPSLPSENVLPSSPSVSKTASRSGPAKSHVLRA